MRKNVLWHMTNGIVNSVEGNAALEVIAAAEAQPTWEAKCQASKVATKVINVANRNRAVAEGKREWYVQSASEPGKGIWVDVSNCS